jgi:hypothetical protein
MTNSLEPDDFEASRLVDALRVYGWEINVLTKQVSHNDRIVARPTLYCQSGKTGFQAWQSVKSDELVSVYRLLHVVEYIPVPRTEAGAINYKALAASIDKINADKWWKEL